jgi:hypothetical protein
VHREKKYDWIAYAEPWQEYILPKRKERDVSREMQLL